MAKNELTVTIRTNKLLLFIIRVICFFKTRPHKWILKTMFKLYMVKIKAGNGKWKYYYFEGWQRLAN